MQGYNQNINGNPVNNYQKSKPENKGLIITITIIVLIISIVGKCLSMGLLTWVLTSTLILPVYFGYFTIAGIHLSNIKNKDKKDYIYFAILCIL